MRSSRLLSLLILLQLRGRMTADALAREFEVSIRTIYRDIDALSAAGIPVYGDKGHGGGFALLEGYRTRLTGLDRDEAAAMPLAALPGAAAALGLGAPAGRARRKLMAALPPKLLTDASVWADRFHLDVSDWYQFSDAPEHLHLLAAAVADARRVSFTYSSWTRRAAWVVDPLGLVLKAGRWYLVATASGAPLTFRVDEMSGFKLLDGHFERPADFVLADWWASSLARMEATLRPEVARLLVSPAGLKRISALGAFAARAVAAAGPADASGWRSVALPVETGDHSVLALLGCGPEFRVLAPAWLRRRLAVLARDMTVQMNAIGRGQKG
jgi:predicted DNA-binding transcriptional regulator YafY